MVNENLNSEQYAARFSKHLTISFVVQLQRTKHKFIKKNVNNMT